jgi:hypothetical protein
MAELTNPSAPAQKSECCSPKAQAGCCAAADKAECCTPESATCGCEIGAPSALDGRGL